MVAIVNKKRTTLQAISEIQTESSLRPYLGMSQLGHSCDRYLWYSFRWCFQEEISARVHRLFNRGHREEPAIVDVLNKVGIIVHSDQEEFVAIHGHCKGHCDGRAFGVIEAPKTEHILEVKTMNDKGFKLLKKEGVKVSKPIYFAQCQLYMGSTGLIRALFIVANKNDDEIYIERVHFEKDTYETLLRRGESIVLSELPPAKKFKPTWYECKWCSAKEICHGDANVEKNCRTCQSCDILQDGCWECSEYDIPLSTSQQRLGCKKYSKLEGL